MKTAATSVPIASDPLADQLAADPEHGRHGDDAEELDAREEE